MGVVKFRFYCTVNVIPILNVKKASVGQKTSVKDIQLNTIYIIKIDNVLTMAHFWFVFLLRMVPLPLKHFSIFNPKNL